MGTDTLGPQAHFIMKKVGPLPELSTKHIKIEALGS
jgi:hypothetical protein